MTSLACVCIRQNPDRYMHPLPWRGVTQCANGVILLIFWISGTLDRGRFLRATQRWAMRQSMRYKRPSRTYRIITYDSPAVVMRPTLATHHRECLRSGQRPMCRPRVYCVAYHATPSRALHRRTPSFCPFRWREPLRPLTAWSARAPVRHSYWKTGRGSSSVRLASVCVPRRRGIDGASSSAALTLAKPSSWLARKSPGVLDEERGRREY